MVGYSQVSKAYRLFDEGTGKIIERRDVIFEEDASVEKETADQHNQNPDDYLIINVEKDQTVPNVPKTSNIHCENLSDECTDSDSASEFTGFETAEEDDAKDKLDNQKESASTGREKPRIKRTGKRGRPRKQPILNNMVEANIPTTVDEAMNSPDSDKWYNAMRSEMSSLNKNGTWSLENLPEGAEAINTKWVFAIKKDEYGQIERYKARLVAKGCSQRYGIDYNETFSPVVRYSTIRLILALAVNWKMYLHQIDISSAYLNSEIHHEIYMRQPEKFVDHKYPHKVLKLHKAIYGLKQSGKEWYKLDLVLKNIGFERSRYESCLYMASLDGQLVLVAVYVDDLIIGCKDEQCVIKVKKLLAEHFPVTDKGPLHHYLGIEIQRQRVTERIRYGRL